MTTEKTYRGQLLLSTPFIGEDYYKHSVMLMCKQLSHHGFGLILNKNLGLRIDAAVEGFPKFDAPVFYGGPYEANRIFCLHSLGRFIKGSVMVVPGIYYYSGCLKGVMQLVAEGVIAPHQIRFFFGYCRWGKGELGEQLKRRNWISTPSAPKYVFDCHPRMLWSKILYDKGDALSVIAREASHLTLN